VNAESRNFANVPNGRDAHNLNREKQGIQGKRKREKREKVRTNRTRKSIMQDGRKPYAFFVRSGVAPICVQVAKIIDQVCATTGLVPDHVVRGLCRNEERPAGVQPAKMGQEDEVHPEAMLMWRR
jgi:hypothetical protein